MYNKILVPMALDHDVSPQTLRVAESMRAEHGQIIALHVYEMPQGSASVFLDEGVVKAGFEAAKLKLQEKLAGFENVTAEIIKGHSARAIIDFASQNDIDCIVMGSHEPGLSDYFLGSTASRVVRHAKCSVVVHRERK